MKIRLAEISDVKDIANIENQCFSTPWSEKSIAESIENENTYLYVAFDDDNNAVGYMGVQIFSGEGYVTNVATLPQYRRQGIAKQLIHRALKNNMEFLSLEVRQSNFSAIQLYKSLGFEKVGVRPKFYRCPDEDAVLMTKFLSKGE